MSRARHGEHSDAGIQDADFEVPPPNGVGPLPHYARGGRRRKKEVEGDGHKSRRRHDRPGRQVGGAMPTGAAGAMPAQGVPPPGAATPMPARRPMMPPPAGAPTGAPMAARGGRHEHERAEGGRTKPGDPGWTPKKDFHPGGEKGKLHREMGIPEGEKIPKDKLDAATHSSDPEKRRDAIRAETMSHWHKGPR